MQLQVQFHLQCESWTEYYVGQFKFCVMWFSLAIRAHLHLATVMRLRCRCDIAPKWLTKWFPSDITATSQSLGVTMQHQNNWLDFGATSQRYRSDVAVARCKWTFSGNQCKRVLWNVCVTQSERSSWILFLMNAEAAAMTTLWTRISSPSCKNTNKQSIGYWILYETFFFPYISNMFYFFHAIQNNSRVFLTLFLANCVNRGHQ